MLSLERDSRVWLCHKQTNVTASGAKFGFLDKGTARQVNNSLNNSPNETAV